MREDFSSLFEGLFDQNQIVRIVMKKKNKNQLKKENRNQRTKLKKKIRRMKNTPKISENSNYLSKTWSEEMGLKVKDGNYRNLEKQSILPHKGER